MDFADASLVAIAEQRGDRTVFTLHSDRRTYRLKGGRHLLLVPQ